MPDRPAFSDPENLNRDTTEVSMSQTTILTLLIGTGILASGAILLLLIQNVAVIFTGEPFTARTSAFLTVVQLFLVPFSLIFIQSPWRVQGIVALGLDVAINAVGIIFLLREKVGPFVFVQVLTLIVESYTAYLVWRIFFHYLSMG
jgi:hypothetical protein